MSSELTDDLLLGDTIMGARETSDTLGEDEKRPPSDFLIIDDDDDDEVEPSCCCCCCCPPSTTVFDDPERSKMGVFMIRTEENEGGGGGIGWFINAASLFSWKEVSSTLTAVFVTATLDDGPGLPSSDCDVSMLSGGGTMWVDS